MVLIDQWLLAMCPKRAAARLRPGLPIGEGSDHGQGILAAAGAALTLGEDHSATRALSRASETMDRVDLWRARLALRTLSKDQREAIAAAVED